ncbi:MAG: glycosyltransferase family 4 protein [Chloroflexi bacterium]|nr:glycosyltransferase family 4 protein [Chloroflexota bacterium]
MPAPRVLHVITRLTLGGSSEATISQLETLAAAGYRCTLAVGFPESDPETLAYARAQGCALVDVPTLGREVSPVRDLRAVGHLARLMRTLRPTVVHTHTSKAGFVGRLAARLVRVPVVLHQPHGHIFYGYFSARRARAFVALERLAARWSDRLLMLTDRGAQEHLVRRIGRADQFVTVPSGVPVDALRAAAPTRAEARARLGVPDHAYVIAALGRLVPIKGFDLLIDALPAVVAACPATRVLVIGDGPLRGSLEARVAQLRLMDHVRFLGALSEPVHALAAADVLAAPSRNEGMGRALVEAMAIGLPVVAAAVGGIPVVVGEATAGILVPPEDAAALGRALLEVADPACRARLAAGATARAALFSTRETARRLLALYAELAPVGARA